MSVSGRHPLRMIEGVEPDAIKGASPVLNGGDEETGLVRPRLVATQLECGDFRPRYTWAKTIVFLHSLTRDQRCVVFCTPATGTPSRVAEPAPRLPGPPQRLGLPQGPGSPAGCVPRRPRAAGAPGHRGLARRARPRSPLPASPSP